MSQMRLIVYAGIAAIVVVVVVLIVKSVVSGVFLIWKLLRK
jgi:hypothetical protein